MWRATFKSLLAKKLRLVLTAVSVVLGIGFVSGTYVLTDTMNAAFEEHRDPFTGHKPSEDYQALYEKILERAPAPIGLGKA